MLIDNKTRIREKAKELFICFGMRSVSMDDIANAIGISKKTLYQHYADKETLVADTIEKILETNNAHCQASREKAQNAIQESFLATETVSELMKKTNPVLLFDMQKYYPAAYRKFLKFKQDFLYNFIRSNIEWGIKDGLYREDINVTLVSSLRIESISLPFQQDFFARVNIDLASLQEEIFILFLYGIATPKGIRLINKYKEQRAKNKI
ncbi:MAG: TetR/AcrR family transcriptional regulator [Niabella sp.]